MIKNNIIVDKFIEGLRNNEWRVDSAIFNSYEEHGGFVSANYECVVKKSNSITAELKINKEIIPSIDDYLQIHTSTFYYPTVCLKSNYFREKSIIIEDRDHIEFLCEFICNNYRNEHQKNNENDDLILEFL